MKIFEGGTIENPTCTTLIIGLPVIFHFVRQSQHLRLPLPRQSRRWNQVPNPQSRLFFFTGLGIADLSLFVHKLLSHLTDLLSAHRWMNCSEIHAWWVRHKTRLWLILEPMFLIKHHFLKNFHLQLHLKSKFEGIEWKCTKTSNFRACGELAQTKVLIKILHKMICYVIFLRWMRLFSLFEKVNTDWNLHPGGNWWNIFYRWGMLPTLFYW